jgi:hypothetical protein
MTAETFYYYSGGSINNGYAEVQSGGSGKEIWTNNVNLEFKFTSVLSSLKLNYGYYRGNVNIKINSTLKNETDIISFNGSVISGASVTVSDPTKGKLTLQGTINSFSTSSHEFVIGHVCPEK